MSESIEALKRQISEQKAEIARLHDEKMTLERVRADLQNTLFRMHNPELAKHVGCGDLDAMGQCEACNQIRALLTPSVPYPPTVLDADTFEHLALMGATKDGRFVLGPGAAERVLAAAQKLTGSALARGYLGDLMSRDGVKAALPPEAIAEICSFLSRP
jgi:hypothetical protein